jgi:putative phosphoesterase
MKIGILSDTHSYMDDRIIHHLKNCDEIWHAGDFGSIEVADKLAALKPLQGVYGNIDGGVLREAYAENNVFETAGCKILLRHIVGKALVYNQRTQDLIKAHKPKILVCGHSHILKVVYDKKNDLLFINPGAAGISGFHNVRTLIRLDIDKGNILNAEVVELGPRTKKVVEEI